MESSVHTELINISLFWFINTGGSLHGSPLEDFYVFLHYSPAVHSLSCSSYLDYLRNKWRVKVPLLFHKVIFFYHLFKTTSCILVLFPLTFFLISICWKLIIQGSSVSLYSQRLGRYILRPSSSVSDYFVHLYWYIHNISADMSSGLQIFELLSSSLLLYSKCFGRYVSLASSSVSDCCLHLYCYIHTVLADMSAFFLPVFRTIVFIIFIFKTFRPIWIALYYHWSLHYKAEC